MFFAYGIIFLTGGTQDQPLESITQLTHLAKYKTTQNPEDSVPLSK